MKLLSTASAAILPFLFSACCTHAQLRFWEVRDTTGGVAAYTVDTVGVPANSLVPRDIRYVDAAGKYLEVKNPHVVRQMSEQEWKTATSGAGYSVAYCGHRGACWAKTKAR